MIVSAANSKKSSAERAARFLAKTVFSLLLLLIVLVAIPYGTVEPWWQALFECAVFVLAALWMIEGFLEGSFNLSSYSLFWPLLGLAAFALLQTVPTTGAETDVSLKVGGLWQAASADPHGTQRWVSKLLALILMAAMLRSYTDTTRRLRLLVGVVIAVCAMSAVFGLVRQMTQHEAGFVLPYLKPGFGYAQFINKNHFPFLMEMALGLLAGLALAEGVRREWLLIYLSLGLLLAGALVSANSRGGVLSLCCEMLFAALLWPSLRRDVSQAQAVTSNSALLWARLRVRSIAVRALLLVCLLAVLVVGIVWVGGDALVGNLEALPTEVGAPAEGIRWSVRRRDIWPATWQLIKEHPLAGSGFGAYWMAITEYHQASGEKTPQEAHNDYLEFLAGGGAVGLLFGGWFIYLFVRRARSSLRESDAFGRAVCFGSLVGLAGVLVHSFVDFGLHITINAVLFFTLIVIATASNRSRSC